MNKYFREIRVGAEFWADGCFWVKLNDTRAESQSTIRTFESDECVTA